MSTTEVDTVYPRGGDRRRPHADTPARAGRAEAAESRKSAAGLATSRSGPATTTPSAPPTPTIALRAATAPPSRSAGPHRRAGPKAHGKTPPASRPGHDVGPDAPRFDLFLDVLLRGLPAREPGVRAPGP